MKILLTTPSFNPHGGIRVIIEWANHLSRRGHEVTLQCFHGVMEKKWIDIDPSVLIRRGRHLYDDGYDVIVATTPPIATLLQRTKTNAKKFALLQMAEDMFQPQNKAYVQQMQEGYQVDFPIIGISEWVEAYVRRFRGDKPMYYIGNGVSEDFQPGKKDDRLTVLAEGWEGYNFAKDQERITAKCAKHLKQKYGAHIIAMSQMPLTHHLDVPDEMVIMPTQAGWVRTMQRGTIMVKATRRDARSCANVEAMACGVPSARGLIQGDDDLIDGYNCLRGRYDLDSVIANAEALIEDEELREELISNGLEYRKTYLSWDYWMEQVENIFADDDRVLVSQFGKSAGSEPGIRLLYSGRQNC